MGNPTKTSFIIFWKPDYHLVDNGIIVKSKWKLKCDKRNLKEGTVTDLCFPLSEEQSTCRRISIQILAGFEDSIW